MQVRISPLHKDFGVLIDGLDSSSHGNPATVELVRRLVAEHKLIMVRDPKMSADDHVGLACILGEVSRRGPSIKAGGTHSFVSNRVVGGQVPEGEMYFHSDQVYMDPPLKVLSLYAVEVPSKGGETHFTDAVLAYSRLSDRLKRRIASLRAFHAIDYSGNKYKKETRGQIDLSRPDAVSATHPIVWMHPTLKQEVLLVNRSQTQYIVGLDPAESKDLLEELYACIEEPDHVYTHRWTPGDLLLWDNWSLQHARNDWPAGEGRTLRRVPIM